MTTVIDAHAHLWDRGRFDYRWLDDEPGMPQTFLAADLAATASGVDDFVFVQADCAPDEGFAEAEWVQSVGGDGLRGIVAFAPLERADAADALDALRELPLVVGVRRLLQSEPPAFFADAGFEAGLRALGERGLPFDACVRWHQLPLLADLVRRHDDVTFVLDHLGKPPIGDPDEICVWRSWLAALTECPNTVVKLSGLPAEARPDTTRDELAELLRTTFDAFGPERSMVGSDWPVSGTAGIGRGEWFELVRAAIGGTEEEWTRVAGGTAAEVYALSGGDAASPR